MTKKVFFALFLIVFLLNSTSHAITLKEFNKLSRDRQSEEFINLSKKDRTLVSDEWMSHFSAQEVQERSVSKILTIFQLAGWILSAYLLIGIVSCFSYNGKRKAQQIFFWWLWLIVRAVDHMNKGRAFPYQK